MSFNFPVFKKLYFFLFLLFFTFLLLNGINYFESRIFQETDSTPPNFLTTLIEVTPPTSPGVVLGTSSKINFVTESGLSSDGGMIVLSNNTLPQISVQTYENATTKVQFSLYQASKEDLINYLIYTKEHQSNWGTPLKKAYQLDTSKLSLVGSFEKDIQSNRGSRNSDILDLPIDKTGVWFLQGKYSDQTIETMVLRTGLGTIAHEGDNELIFWVQDEKYQSAPKADLALYNLEGAPNQINLLSTNEQGVARAAVNDAYDIALVSKGDDFTILPIRLQSLNYRSSGIYSSFSRRQSSTQSFLFTDRFLYRPGDVINFKAILRDNDDVQYSLKSGVVTIKVGSYDSPFFEKTINISQIGTVDESVKVPDDLDVGYYTLSVYQGDDYLTGTTIEVANYRKPDSIISVKSERMQYLPGDTVRVRVSGEYFLGQPIKNGKVRYKIYQQLAYLKGEFSDISYTDRLTYFGEGGDAVAEGELNLDEQGEAWLELPAKNSTGFRQFWLVNFEYLDGSSNATNDGIRTLIEPGDFVIEHSMDEAITSEQGMKSSLPIQLQRTKDGAKISKVSLSGKLYRSVNGNYILEKDGLGAITDESGKTTFTFTPEQSSAYKFEIEAKDESGNTIRDEETFFAQSSGYYAKLKLDFYSISADKETYSVGDTAKFSIKTNPEIKNVFISLGREFSRQYWVLPVSDGKAFLETQIIEPYKPNFYLMVGSFEGNRWRSKVQNFSVNSEDKHVSVRISTDQVKYGPQEDARITIEAVDGNGKPVQTDLALWVFDKSLLELHGVYFKGIFEKFWKKQFFSISTNHSYSGITSDGAENGGGCFSGDTKVTLADGSDKPISEIIVGEEIQTLNNVEDRQLVSAKVANVHRVSVNGYLIINAVLHVTPEHRLYVNNSWKTAGEIKIGDQLLNSQGQMIGVRSIEWIRRPITVYNLEIEKYHTYLAGNFYVHNDKGDSRSVFKDTAYWNPHVTTNQEGKAELTIPLPDNLTTWVVAAVSANIQTQVGEGTAEFIVAKDVVVKPILPRFFRQGDIVQLSALLHNFTDYSKSFNISASFTHGELEKPLQTTSLSENSLTELFFPMTITKESGMATFVVKAIDQNDKTTTDQVTEMLPIYRYGNLQTFYTEGKDAVEMLLSEISGADQNLSEGVLNLRTTRYPQFLTLLDSKYKNTSYPESAARTLIIYSILKQNSSDLGLTTSSEEIDSTIFMALESLENSRNQDGVWEDGKQNFDPLRTLYLTESLSVAQNAGVHVDQTMISKIISYYLSWSGNGWIGDAQKQYVFSLFPEVKIDRKAVKLPESVTHPEMYAIGQLANNRQNFSVDSGPTATLVANALETPTQLTWNYQYGDSRSWSDIIRPTIWATRSLIASDADTARIEKSLDYLYRNDFYEDVDTSALLLATIEYYQKTNQLAPNFSYTIHLADKIVVEGSVTRVSQNISSLSIPINAENLNKEVRIDKNGTGTLFSQFVRKEFMSDRELTKEQHGISISRSYLSTKESGKPVDVGDLIVVQFRITGLGRGEQYIEVEDFLPSGLVAIDETLDNGNFENPDKNSSFQCQELTDQGMHICTSRIFYDDGIYSYKARVVTRGVFDAPPAVVKLTNQPQIWARTDSDRLVIDGKNSLEVLRPKNLAQFDSTSSDQKEQKWNLFSLPALAAIPLTLGIILILTGVVWIKRVAILSIFRRTPPTEPPIPMP